MHPRSPCFTALAGALALLLAAGVAAQEKKPEGPKLYRWVDKQGKVHYDDALPPEAVNQARREYSAAVKTKSFIISVFLLPLLMGGGAIAQLLLKNQVDIEIQTVKRRLDIANRKRARHGL